jgi:hypothetical protein
MKASLFLAAAFWAATLWTTHAEILGQWNFNDTNAPVTAPLPSTGAGSASLVGGTKGDVVGGASSDAGSPNKAWSVTHYPAVAASNRTAGVRFDVPTTGYEHITLSWAQENSSSASRYSRLQYTVDGSTFVDAGLVAVFKSGSFTNLTADLSGLAGATNNPLFGFRLVAEFESTATGNGTNGYVPTDSATYHTSGTIHYDLVTISGTPLPGSNTNRPPYLVASFTSQTLRPGESTDALPFTVLDSEDPADSLTVLAASSNPTVIPVTNIALSGAKDQRAITVRAGDQSGVSVVTVWVLDTGGKSNSASFSVTVLPANSPPSISTLPHTNTLGNVPLGPIAFSVSDPETPAASLDVSAVSANPALLPNTPDHISLGGSGTNRTLTLTPTPGRLGIAPITLTVSDGTNAAATTFTLMVSPSTNVLCYEPFDYPDGSLTTNSLFLWDTRSGIAGQTRVVSNQLQLAAAQTEDLCAPLIGAPYVRSNGTKLYASFKVKFLSLPKATPGCFASFGNGTSLHGRLCAGIIDAAPGMFRLAVANATDTNSVAFAANLSTNTTYTVVTRYDVDTANTTLWVNPHAETDSAANAVDTATPGTISWFGFRQDSSWGAALSLDDLRVGLTFASVTSPLPPLLGIRPAGGRVVLSWTQPGCSLQWAPGLTGPFATITGAASPYTNTLAGSVGFFRLKVE